MRASDSGAEIRSREYPRPSGYRSGDSLPKPSNVHNRLVGRYDERMKKPLLTLIIAAILVAVGLKIYKAMTVEVPVEDQG